MASKHLSALAKDSKEYMLGKEAIDNAIRGNEEDRQKKEAINKKAWEES